MKLLHKGRLLEIKNSASTRVADCGPHQPDIVVRSQGYRGTSASR